MAAPCFLNCRNIHTSRLSTYSVGTLQLPVAEVWVLDSTYTLHCPRSVLSGASVLGQKNISRRWALEHLVIVLFVLGQSLFSAEVADTLGLIGMEHQWPSLERRPTVGADRPVIVTLSVPRDRMSHHTHRQHSWPC